MSMRILVLAMSYWPEQTGIGPVLTRRCEFLASTGHEVTVCTGMPWYPEWQIHPDYARKLFLHEKHNGVTILRSWMWVPKKVTSIKRIVFEGSFLASSLLCACHNDKPELLLVVSPPLGLGLSAVLFNRWWRIPYVFDVQDLQPDAAADLGLLPRPMLPILYQLESMIYRNASLILTVTEGMRRKIVGKGISRDKIVVVPPCADNSLFAVGISVNGQDFRRKHGLERKFIVAHSGNMGVKQGLDLVLDAAFKLRAESAFVFLLVGDGVTRCRLEERAAALALRNVHFLPLQQQAEFLQLLAATDIALIVQRSTVSDIVFPSKAVTLLSAARPIVASVSAETEIGRVIRESGGGVVMEPENTQALVASIQQLSNDRQKRLTMGECGRQYALHHWDETRVLSKFEAHLLKARAVPEC